MTIEPFFISHLTSMHDWNDDRIFQRACVGLARNGHRVELIAMEDDKVPFDSSLSKGVDVKLVPSARGKKRRWYTSKAVVETAIASEAKIFVFHDPDLLPHIKRLRKKRPDATIVYDIHENYAGRFKDWGLPSFLGSIFRRYELQVINKIHGITVVSESMKQLFQSSSTPCEITRNSTDLSRLQDLQFDKSRSDKKLIITSGSHSHARHALQTVQALAHLDEKILEGVEMLFAGRYNGSIETEMKDQAQRDARSSFLNLQGMLPWEENFKRIEKGYLGCVFYEDNANNRVGIPNRLFEYMFCGLPVVVSDFPELRKVVESAKCGLIVDSTDPKSIAKAFEFLLLNQDEAKQMGLRGKKAMESEFGYHIDLARLESFLQKIQVTTSK